MRSICPLRALLVLVIAALLPVGAFARIYIANWTLNQINIYPSTASGTPAPTTSIVGSNTGLSEPYGVAVDANYIYAANFENSSGGVGNSVTIYPLSASGNVAPVATIAGSNTGLGNCIGVAVDANYIYVVSESCVNHVFGSVSVFSKTANGNVAPIRVIGGPAADIPSENLTGLVAPYGIAVDSNYIYVTNPIGGAIVGGTVCAFPLTANGNVAPSIYFPGAPIGDSQPVGIAVDANYLYVTDETNQKVLLYALAGFNSNSTPAAAISGSSTGLSGPVGIAVDGSRIYVRNTGNETITDFPLTASGNVAPSAILGGVNSNSDIYQGLLMAEDTTTFIHFVVSAPSTAITGTPFNVVVTAMDDYGNTVTGYAGTVHFTSTDGAAVLPANTTLTNGTGTFAVTLNTDLAQTVTATDTVTSFIAGTSGTIAVAGVVTHFSVSLTSASFVGNTNTVTVTALNSSNATVTSYSGIVHLTSTDPTAVISANSTLNLGTGSFTIAFKTSGTQTVTAADSVATSLTGTSANVNVIPGGATHFSVSAPSTATTGTAVNVTVTALDYLNNVATGYTGYFHFTSTDGSAALPVYGTLTAGTGTFPVTFNTAGSQTVTATDANTGSITGTSGSVTVTVGAAAPTHFSVSAPGSASAGTPFNVTVTALNSSNAQVTGYAGTIHFASTDGSAVLPANIVLTGGSGIFSVTLKTSGSQTVTVNDLNTPAITGTSGSIPVAAGAAAHFVVAAPGTATAGTPVNVTVTAVDALNNTATAYAGTVHFTSSDGSAILPANTTLTNGTGLFSVTLNTGGSQTVTATDTVSTVTTGASGAILVSAAPATHFSVSAPSTAIPGTAISVTVTALTAANATATAYTGTVHFTSSDGSAILPANATLTNGTGLFSATLNTAGSQAVTATDTVNAAITGASGSIVVSLPAATHFTVSAPSTAIPGTAISVTVTALNSSNATATAYAGTVHIASSDGSATLPANATLTNGTGTFPVTLQTVGSQTVTATDTVTNTITGTSGAIVVSAPPATHFSVSAPSTATLGTAISVTVTALTAANVTATAYTGTVHITSSDGGATLPANATLTNGTGTFSVTLQTVGSQTVTATDTVTNTITGTSGTIVVNAPPATHFSVSAPSTATSGTAISVTVTALTASNATATAYTGTVHFTSSDGSATLAADATLANGTGIFSITLNTAGSQTVTATDTVTNSITGASGAITVLATPAMVGVGGIGGAGGVAAPPGKVSPDASGQSSTLAAYINAGSTGGTLVGYIASINAGFTANFTLTVGRFTTTTTTLTGGTSLGQTLTVTGTLANGVLSGTIAPLGLPFSVTLDAATGASAAVSGLYAASGSTSGSLIYSIVGTQGEVFVLAVSPGQVSAGVGTVNANDTFTVVTSLGTTISGSVNPSTTAIAGTTTTSGGTPVAFSGESSVQSPTVAPTTPSFASGTTGTLTVSSSASSATYQWQFNGVPIAGATGATLTLPNIGTTQAGNYSAVVTSGGSSVVSNSATVAVTYNAWLANLSTRAYVAPTLSSADVLIAGFVTVGPASKQLLVRGVGPGLQQFGVPGFLPNPSLTVYSGSAPGATLTSWSASLTSEFASLGAFPLPAGSLDTATLNTFSPGPYTAIVNSATGGQNGIALVEVYDADNGAPTNRLINISGLAYVGTGANVLVGGFVINGTTAETVLVRAVGPALSGAPFNVPGALAQPLLQVYDTNPNHSASGPQLITQIQGWSTAPTLGTSSVAAGIQPATAAIFSAVGAFSLPSRSADSALVLTLPPGAYTTEVLSASGGTGIALVEIYEVP